MPIYEYKCRDCGSKFEVLVYSGQENIICEKCGSNNQEKLMSGFASSPASGNNTASCGGSGAFT